MAVLLLTTDLMATSSAAGAAEQAGVAIQTVAPAAAADLLDNATRLVALDLTAKGVDLPALVASVRERAPGAALLAYGPHVHAARLQAAADAGFDQVLSRGQFHRQMGDLFARYAAAD